MRILLMLALLVMLDRPAEAGPWCGGTPNVSPIDEAVLPVGAKILYARYALRYSGKLRSNKPQRISATLDGKPVKLAITDVKQGEWQFRFLDVMSRKAGKLEIKADDNLQVRHTLDASWKRPTKVTATVGRFKESTGEMQERDYEGLAVSVDVPVLSFIVRWRRDDKDTWRSFEVPAMTHHGTQQHTAFIGETQCGNANIPVSLLDQGIELEVTVRLPDGSKAAVEGLPKPVTRPSRPAGDP